MELLKMYDLVLLLCEWYSFFIKAISTIFNQHVTRKIHVGNVLSETKFEIHSQLLSFTTVPKVFRICAAETILKNICDIEYDI